MLVSQQFPEDRSTLKCIRLAASGAEASAVLLDPKWERGRQKLLLLGGSVLRYGSVSSCPEKAKRIRQDLKEMGRVCSDGYGRLVLRRDLVIESLSLAACIVMGASKNGWDFWTFNGRLLDEVKDKLVFYDPTTLPPNSPM
jgi:hypothetical protein